MSANQFWHDCGCVFDEVAAKTFSPAHVLCPARPIVIHASS